jgi:hypothetical protein
MKGAEIFCISKTFSTASLFHNIRYHDMCINNQHVSAPLRFPDNFALFRDDESEHHVAAIWITGFSKEDDVKNTVVKGHRFRNMKAAYEDKYFSMASLHSYQVWGIEETPSDYHVSNLIGKASCTFLGKEEDLVEGGAPLCKTLNNSTLEYKVPNPQHHFHFELLDHCIDYTNVKPKASLPPPRVYPTTVVDNPTPAVDKPKIPKIRRKRPAREVV